MQAASVLEGFSQERLYCTADAMVRQVENGNIPGAVTLIARKGEIVRLGWTARRF